MHSSKLSFHCNSFQDRPTDCEQVLFPFPLTPTGHLNKRPAFYLSNRCTGRYTFRRFSSDFRLSLKYFNLFAGGMNRFLGKAGMTGSVPILHLVLPLGISFYTFQSAGYLIDVYREKTEPERNPAKYALFVSFFPQIIQGPISFYDQLAHQLYADRKFSYRNLKHGALLMLWGYLKKMVIADRAVSLIQMVAPDYTQYNGTVIFITVLVYALQLYADFSGGIDISRGFAEILGIEMAENFRRPYFAVSINDYWRRWHITLGAWMKSYVFYSLAMSKRFFKMGKNLKQKSDKRSNSCRQYFCNMSSDCMITVFLFQVFTHFKKAF